MTKIFENLVSFLKLANITVTVPLSLLATDKKRQLIKCLLSIKWYLRFYPIYLYDEIISLFLENYI